MCLFLPSKIGRKSFLLRIFHFCPKSDDLKDISFHSICGIPIYSNNCKSHR